MIPRCVAVTIHLDDIMQHVTDCKIINLSDECASEHFKPLCLEHYVL